MGALRYTLIVRHPETAEPVALLAGQPVPEWASGLVHPDDLEVDEPEPVGPDEPDESAPAKKAPAKRASSKTEK